MPIVCIALLGGLCLTGSCKDEPASKGTKVPVPSSAPATQKASASVPTSPSPEYPTAAAAGTKELFFLEEPDRGEHITIVPFPADGKITMKSGRCELDEHDVVCVPGPGPFLVRQAGSTRVVEEVGDGGLERAYVIEQAANGDLTQMALFDSHSRIVWVRSYKNGGTRYSSRNLDGSNALEGCGSMALTLDTNRRATAVACLQWSGSPMLDAAGVARTTLTRNAQGLVQRMEFFDVGNAATERHDGVHAEVYERSERGLILRTDYFGLDNAPVISTRSGCVSEAFSYDENGREVGRTCLDAEGKLVAGLEGIARTTFKRDDAGCTISESFFDATGKPQASRRRGHQQRFVVKQHCEVTSESCHDASGALEACEGEVARRSHELDRLGQVVSTKHFDTQNQPVGDSRLASFELRYSYDALGNQTEVTCFDNVGRPKICSSTGAHAIVEAVDDAGRNVETRYLNESREPTMSLGATVSRSVYDNYDHLSRLLREDQAGNLISSRGMSKVHFLYDRGHQTFGVLLLNADDSPADFEGCFVSIDCPRRPWHALRVVRSESGEVVSNIFFNAKKQQIKVNDCTTSRCWED